MTLLFRAVWNDDTPDLFAMACDTFEAWLARKKIEIELPNDGTTTDLSELGPVETTTRRASADGVSALRVELHEERSGSGERWSTILTALKGPDEEQFLWVDLERVADDFSQRPNAPAPNLVRMLIQSGVDPRVDHVRLTTKPTALPPEALAGLVRNTDRSLPIIVFSHDPAFAPDATITRAERTQHHLMGAAQVHLLGPEASGEFRACIGDELAVWHGSARLYLPNRDASGLRPDRHRYILPGRMGLDWSQPARMFSGMLAGVVSARRAPHTYEAVRRGLREGAAQSTAELLTIAEREIDRLRKERDDLHLRLAALESDLFDTQADFEEANTEVARLQGELIWSRVDQTTTEPDIGRLQLLTDVPGTID